MDTNENARTGNSDEVIELGIASIETKGIVTTQTNEVMGRRADLGITE